MTEKEEMDVFEEIREAVKNLSPKAERADEDTLEYMEDEKISKEDLEEFEKGE